MAIQGFFTGDVKIRDLNGVLRAVDGIVEVATDAGTVTSVGLTVGSTGTDVNVSNSPVTTSGNITLNLPTASATNRGLLSSADWTTFNSKQGTITLTTTGSSGAATLIGTTLNIPNYSGALTGYVPYTGATTNVDLGEYGISSGYFQADLTPSGTLQVGRMQWNSTDGTMDLRLMGNNVTLQIGQEQVARVVNGTGVNLLESNYQAVKIIGAQGQRLQVGLARADNDANSKDTLGLVTENINNNQEGFITVSGLVNEINTTGSLQGETWADGDTLYLSGTTSGAITNVKPTAPIHTVIVGFVVYAHANHGKIFVKVDNGYELEELHDVAPAPYVNKGVLYRDTATNLWKSATIGTLLGYTPANAATTLTINGTAYDLSANRTWNVGTVTSIGTSGPLTGGTITGSGTIGITQATTSTDGYLSSTDWNTFNNKQAAGSYITALTGEATATGPGSASVTLSTSAVTGKLLTGLNLTGGGTIADTDSILQAFGKVQNQISGLAGGVTYQGVWNASTNTPTLTSSVGTKGYYYIVDVAGSTNLNGITDWKVGDWAIFNGSTWDKVDNTDAVSSVNGFTGAVSLTTSNIAEGTNLYYLDSRARLALSFTAGSGAYDNTTGVITIPTNTSQLTNGANFITLSSLSASSPLSYNNVSGAFSIQVANGSQNGYLSSSDWTTFNNKQAALTLTTTGSSGSSTLVGATLNVPTYTLSGLGGVPTSRTLTINGTSYDLSSDRTWSVGTITGTGTSNYLPKWQSSSALGDSLVYDASTAILIGTTTASTAKFMVYSATADNHYQAIGSAPSFRFADTITSPTYTGIIGLATASNHFIVGAAAGDMVLANNTTSSLGNFIFGTGTTERMRITPTGNVSINNTNNTYRFDVNGTVRFTGQLRLESTITNGTYTYTLPGATGTLALVGGAGVGTVTSIATTGPITGGTITSTGTIGITQATSSTDGYLSSTDWTTFNNKQDALTNPVTGTGTTNYLPKFTGASTIGDSIITDNGYYAGFNFTGSGSLGGQNFGVDSVGAFQNNLGSYGYRWLINGGGTEIMRLDASGNLGLGVSPSAWLSGYPVIQMPQLSIFSGAGGGGFIFGNAYLNTSGSFTYQNSGLGASAYNNQGGAHQWSVAPSGTAGNAISFTQAMTLGANGNLTLGTTSSYSGVRFVSEFTTGVAAWFITGGDSVPVSLINNGGAVSTIGFKGTSTANAFNVRVGADGENLIAYTSNTERFRIASTGAATFSSSVTAGGKITSGAGAYRAGGFYVPYSTASAGSRTWAMTNDEIAFGDFSIIQSTTQTGDVNLYRLYINPSGNVGIGTTSPSDRLNVVVGSNGNNTRLDGPTSGLIFQTNATTTDIISYGGTTPAYRALNFSASASTNMTITTGGNVGIGTTSPAALLHVNTSGSAVGGIRLTSATNTNGSAFVANNAGGDSYFGRNNSTGGAFGGDAYSTVVYSGGAYPMSFYTNDTERMRITSGGNVGIGTTSPQTLLHLASATPGIFIDDTSTTGTRTRFRITTGDIGTTQAALFQFDNTSGTNLITTMIVNELGNVGIGTTSPVSVSGHTSLTINGSSITRLDQFVSGTSIGLLYSASSFTMLETTGANPLLFGTNDTERMRITSGGQLLIGTTSSSGVDKVRVNNDGTTSYSTVNITNANSTANMYVGVGGSSVANGSLQNNAYVWNAAASALVFGTSDSERMRITSSGNVGINTNNPQRQLDVASPSIAYIRTTQGTSSVFNEMYSTSMGGFIGTASSHNLALQTAGTTRMTITNGGLLFINTTMQVATGFVSLVAPLSTNIGFAIRSTNAGNSGQFMQFQNSSSVQAGAITHTGATTVAFTTTSDYRLKQDFQDFNGLDLLGKIKMYNYEWKEDKSRAYGVIAHELQSIIGYAVSGVKDGDTMQGVDYSKIVPVLVKAVQEQQTQIKELKSQLNK